MNEEREVEVGTGNGRLTHWHLSIETVISTLVLLCGIVFSYASLSAQVEAQSNALGLVGSRLEILQERVRIHELLPIHPMARVELDNLIRRIQQGEERTERCCAANGR